jgi:hypothetical protein
VTGHPDLRGRVGGLTRRNAPPEKIAEARRALTKANLGEHIRAAVAGWPPLTPEDKAELAILLLNPGGTDAP